MDILGIYGSPRYGGNTSILLDHLLSGAKEAGGKIRRLYLKDLQFSPCSACGHCEQSGQCLIQDGISQAHRLLQTCQVAVLAFPVYFYGPPAQVKAFIDRAQACFQARRLSQRASPAPQPPERGAGYLLSAGGSRGGKLFAPSELICKYFFDALGMRYGGGMFFRRLEQAGAALNYQDYLLAARQWGARLVLQSGKLKEKTIYN
jgi:multimeric flavodoxin WrbA